MLAGFGRLVVLATLVGAGYRSSSSLTGALVGLGVGVVFLVLETSVGRSTPRKVIAGSCGLAGGLVLALLAGSALAAGGGAIEAASRLALTVGLGWIGLATGVRHASRFSLARLRADWQAPSDPLAASVTPKILDTSVIIDGRVAEIVDAGFMEGPLLIPQFVLGELQQVADSSDPLKRNRGRRGLDMLQRLQKNQPVAVRIVDTDFPEVREVDLKLIELAIKTEGKIVTNDFNLNKVAQLRGVEILNINDLANCLRPLVLPGEPMRVFVSKEGKEYGQGVGYLDDGTMVVVEGGRRALGRTIDVSVTTVLQTAAGKMIFVRWPEAPADELSRKDPKSVLRRTEGRNGTEDRASAEDTEEVPVASRVTAEVLPAVANGTSNRNR